MDFSLKESNFGVMCRVNKGGKGPFLVIEVLPNI